MGSDLIERLRAKVWTTGRSGNLLPSREPPTINIEAADEITALRERVAAADEVFVELVGSLTQHGRNRDTMLSINHDALRSIVSKARALLANRGGANG